MSFLQRGLLLSTVAAVFFVTGNGQFAVSSPFYADDVSVSERYRPNELAYRAAPLRKDSQGKEPNTSSVFARSSVNAEENRRHAKGTSSDNRDKKWLVQETDEVSQTVPNIYGYPEEQNEIRVRYFNTLNTPEQSYQERDMESNQSRIRALLAMRALASQLGNLLFFLENAPSQLPLSMFMLRGLINLNQQEKPPSNDLISSSKDSTDEKQPSDLSKLDEKMTAEQLPIVFPFGMLPENPGGGQNPNAGGLSQYKNSPESKTGRPNSEEAFRSRKLGTQLSDEFNPMMNYYEYNNDIVSSDFPRLNFNSGRRGGRSRIDNNLRRVPDVPYSGFFPDYNPEDSYSGALDSGYYPPNDYDSMQSPYGRPKDHHKKSWKKEQEKILKEKLDRDDFGEEGSRKSSSKKHSKKRRKGMNRDEINDYMYWPPPPSYLM